MSLEKLDAVQQYFDSHLTKNFFPVRFLSYYLPIFFANKSAEKIESCVNYKRLNAII